jgi:hypothetical protein
MTTAWAEFERYEEQIRNEGRNEGRKAGAAQSLREAIVDMCELLGLEVSAEQRAQLATMDLDRLAAIIHKGAFHVRRDGVDSWDHW